MVYFVCNGCQDTLKLRALDLHRCNSTFCCVDCSKDFTYDGARGHNTCVSEAEKYEKSLYKGKAKTKVDPQEIWTQQIVSLASNSVKHRGLLEKLSAYTNVPRKAPKFINFAKNSLGVRDERILKEIFEMINAAMPKPETPARPAAGGAGAVANEDMSAEAASPSVKSHKSDAKTEVVDDTVSGKKRARHDISEDDSSHKFDIKKRLTQLLELEGKVKCKRLRKKVAEEAVSLGKYSDMDAAEEAVEKRFNKLLAKGKIVTDSAGKFAILVQDA